MNESRAGELVTQIDQALQQLAELLAQPEIAHFEALFPAFERLERVWHTKAAIDAAFAWAADLNEAGLKVGSSNVIDYLSQNLDISRKEAHARLERGRALYDPPVVAAVEDLVEEQAIQSCSESERIAMEEQRRQREAEARERQRREELAQKAAREKIASAEKRSTIERELKSLAPGATPGFNEILNAALSYATNHSIPDVQQWVREEVRKANRSLTKEKKRNVAFHRRYISISEADENGGVRISGYLPADMAAVLSEALNPERTNILKDSDLETTEGMSMGQKRTHLLVAMCRNFLNTKTPNLRGVGSIVVSMTLEELENMGLDDVFISNTGHLIDPFALARLGEAKSDAFVFHADNGEPLHVGTGKRTANLYHRLAAFAADAMCTHPGCTKPASECQAHHIIAHSNGGETHAGNFGYLCWGHHRDNNDDRDPHKPFGWADKDPETGRVGYRPREGEPLEFNETPLARYSAAAKIRARNGFSKQLEQEQQALFAV